MLARATARHHPSALALAAACLLPLGHATSATAQAMPPVGASRTTDVVVLEQPTDGSPPRPPTGATPLRVTAPADGGPGANPSPSGLPPVRRRYRSRVQLEAVPIERRALTAPAGMRWVRASLFAPTFEPGDGPAGPGLGAAGLPRDDAYAGGLWTQASVADVELGRAYPRGLEVAGRLAGVVRGFGSGVVVTGAVRGAAPVGSRGALGGRLALSLASERTVAASIELPARAVRGPWTIDTRLSAAALVQFPDGAARNEPPAGRTQLVDTVHGSVSAQLALVRRVGAFDLGGYLGLNARLAAPDDSRWEPASTERIEDTWLVHWGATARTTIRGPRAPWIVGLRIGGEHGIDTYGHAPSFQLALTRLVD